MMVEYPTIEQANQGYDACLKIVPILRKMDNAIVVMTTISTALDQYFADHGYTIKEADHFCARLFDGMLKGHKEIGLPEKRN